MNHLEKAIFEIRRVDDYDSKHTKSQQRQSMAYALIAIAERLLYIEKNTRDLGEIVKQLNETNNLLEDK